ncbi:glycoside hydrolase family 99-like domain-containing protein [Planktothrix agardhii]|uniref:glycoside hydrolase family 99-like domain-containing protein n=1 Tax=Planktothrix agardhii TaxID=1160 RepID=UPI000DBAEA65|nr:glycoside hydrolase family 99-like domain-containing protein [Planktothrix agardhii]BBD54337.1 polysaccharide biosynthesis protein [Planktothrix agardhii NIES-204]MCF3577490.1 glycoside hydrolase family 99-like domain-containing protein [Planktothrix agardhii 1812]MCF3577600.1 glycoside hydrolase family 99-like domain-containing protein [Planktothrix agardhii 1812]MCF3579042.1 glycoside hydrolase family 99-like domain-containing protein [Planktothrix agardhii 1811]MCF3579239.1 glycoside hyd
MVIQQQPSSLSDRPQVSSMVKSRRRSVSPAEPSYRLAQALVKQEKWQEAIAAYQQALIITPNWVEVQRELGDLFLKLERWDEAVQVYETAIGLRSEGAEVYHNLGDALLKLQRWEDAIAAYEKAIELNPEFSWSYNNLGDGLRELQRWDKAAQAYQKAIELKSDFALSHHNLGDVLVKKEDWENAIAAYQKAVDLDPNFVWSYYNLAEVYVKLDQWDEAVEVYRQVLKIKPDLTEVEEKLNRALHQQVKTRLETALSYYRKAIKNDPTDVESYQKALEIKPDDADLHLGLENALITKSKQQELIEGCQKAIVFNVDLEKELEESLQKCNEFLEFSPNNEQIISIQKEIPEILEIESLNIIKLVFNEKYYLENNLDIDINKIDPLIHYLKQGYKEGRNPHPLFNSAYYLEKNPDVASHGINPLLHYMNQGYKENRDPSPFFNSSYYLKLNPDLEEKNINPLLHYIYNNEKPAEKSEDMTFNDASPCVVDWRKYMFAKKQLETLKNTKLKQLQVTPPVLISVELKTLKKAINLLNFSNFKQPKVSIIIPVFNQIKYTIECLTSVKKYTSDINYEIIVIDDCSEDETESILKEIENITYLRNTENLGFLLSCNKAYQKASGEYLVILNNDVQVTNNWLSPLIETCEKFTDVGIVGPKIIYPNGYLQEAGTRINRDGSTQLIGLNDDPNLPRYNYIREVEYCSGACLLVKTALFKAVGGFDPIYQPAYYEDADLNFRIRSQGYKTYYQPNSTVIHHLSVSSDVLPCSYKMMMTQRNKHKFCERWQEKLEELNTVKLIAFYLPQFHPIPENNRWWGKGFTEWTNVAKARPNYVGHYQPHIPADLGFYNLKLDNIIDEQAQLASKYGIYGFCYYYYWFAGKRLLEMPIERILKENKPDFPFCLAWANENWTRRWDGKDSNILISQNHSDEDDKNCILDLIRYFKNDNYIRINSKPLLLIYQPNLFPDIKKTVEIWRQTAWKEGIGEIYLVMVESFDAAGANINPNKYGFDAAVEFPPHNMGIKGIPPGEIINPNFSGYIYDYRQIPLDWLSKEIPVYTRFRGIMPSWDNTPRQQDRATIFEYASPGIYQAWLEEAIAQTLEQNFGDERIVFINAWNEWAEGTHLEPDLHFGHRWLEATRNALDSWLLTDS